MSLKFSVVAAIALAAIVAVPSASYAASKHKGAASSETGLTNPANCTGGGCTSQNPDRVGQPGNGANRYKRLRKHKSSPAAPKTSEQVEDLQNRSPKRKWWCNNRALTARKHV